MARRYAGILPDLSLLVFWPPTVTLPRVGRSSSAINLSTLLLPAPDRPVRNTNSPGWMLNETPASPSRPLG